MIAFSQSDSPIISQKQLDVIDETELRAHLEFIASDELKGRETGTDELKIASKYLATRLKSYGFKGLGPNGSFFQDVPLIKYQYITSRSMIYYDTDKVNGVYGKDYVIYSFGIEKVNLEGDLVSVGSGIYNDSVKTYQKSDVEGKIAVRFGNPKEHDHRAVRNTLFDNGANAVIWVIDEDTLSEKLIKAYAGYASRGQMDIDGSEENKTVYILMTDELFNQLNDDVTKTSVETLEKMRIIMPSKIERLTSRNVIAYLEGSDPKLKNEYVGFGSHYDHEGIKDGEIYNGADDDGSGTVGVLQVAKALSTNPPKRSIFINFHTAEEKGLFGSAYYAENPAFPLSQLVAMVNIDMIGSYYKPNKVDIVGADRISQDLHDINEKMNAHFTKMKLDYTYNQKGHPERIYYRSDHYNYAKNGVPVIFYTNDNPKHYHKPSDTVETINFKKLTRITKLALATGYHVANQKERIKITSPVKKEN